jgi:hypothetical protein
MARLPPPPSLFLRAGEVRIREKLRSKGNVKGDGQECPSHTGNVKNV